MDTARDEIRLLQDTPLDDPFVRTVISFDGAYQKRTGKSGGGFSRTALLPPLSLALRRS